MLLCFFLSGVRKVGNNSHPLFYLQGIKIPFDDQSISLICPLRSYINPTKHLDSKCYYPSYQFFWSSSSFVASLIVYLVSLTISSLNTTFYLPLMFLTFEFELILILPIPIFEIRVRRSISSFFLPCLHPPPLIALFLPTRLSFVSSFTGLRSNRSLLLSSFILPIVLQLSFFFFSLFLLFLLLLLLPNHCFLVLFCFLSPFSSI